MLQSYEDQLFNNPYPGRTIIVGMSPSGKHFVQVYWIMGRSANSRNRIFERKKAKRSVILHPSFLTLRLFYKRDWSLHSHL